jgi:predicted acyltransferase
MTPLVAPFIPSLAFAVVFVAVWWLIVYTMDRHHVYLKL